jgi:hypothetical protein
MMKHVLKNPFDNFRQTALVSVNNWLRVTRETMLKQEVSVVY